MSEHEVYPSSVSSFHFVDVEFEADCSRSNFGDKVARFSIGVVRGVVQLVQNRFKGIPNTTRSSSLG